MAHFPAEIRHNALSLRTPPFMAAAGHDVLHGGGVARDMLQVVVVAADVEGGAVLLEQRPQLPLHPVRLPPVAVQKRSLRHMVKIVDPQCC